MDELPIIPFRVYFNTEASFRKLILPNIPNLGYLHYICAIQHYEIQNRHTQRTPARHIARTGYPVARHHENRTLQKTGIRYSRICEIISGKRKMTLEQSLKLERDLGYDEGFLMTLQTSLRYQNVPAGRRRFARSAGTLPGAILGYQDRKYRLAAPQTRRYRACDGLWQ